METLFWGTDGWIFLHTLTFLYPDKPTFENKTHMLEFMRNISYILPCKYCRASFTKYSKSLSISKFLESKEKVVEWLYRMHNKVNGKLKKQGLCNKPNPSLEFVHNKYKPILKHIESLANIKKDTYDILSSVVNYICKMGLNFLGSIIFNYQSYFSNCHTTDEKTKIINVYHSFFNSIVPMIAGFLNINPPKKCYSIRNILLRNEAYTKLIKWFYMQNHLVNVDEIFKCYDKYIEYFNKHIVASCNNPRPNKNSVKSCRKTIKISTTTISSVKNHVSKTTNKSR